MTYCWSPTTLPDVRIVVIIWFLTVFLLMGFPALIAFRSSRSSVSRILLLVSFPIAYLALSLLGFIFMAVMLLDDNPPSHKYRILNYATQNTCLVDPRRANCPKDASGVIAIDARKFSALARDAELTYQYYPEVNEYTLIVRPHNLIWSDNRVVVFDPRLTVTQDYGNRLDFVDVEVEFCSSGKYRLKNPPPFPGPWDEIN